MTQYNGWTNKETWLVVIWYMSEMTEYYAEIAQFHVEPDELEETVRYIAEECEALSQLKAGLFSDFICACWAEVNWRELVDQLNKNLKKLEN